MNKAAAPKIKWGFGKSIINVTSYKAVVSKHKGMKEGLNASRNALFDERLMDMYDNGEH